VSLRLAHSSRRVAAQRLPQHASSQSQSAIHRKLPSILNREKNLFFRRYRGRLAARRRRGWPERIAHRGRCRDADPSQNTSHLNIMMVEGRLYRFIYLHVDCGAR
jgi:hypothetical protein